MSNDDGELDFFINSLDVPIASLFSSINTSSKILSVKVFMGSNNSISIQIRENDVNSTPKYQLSNIIPAINAWTEIRLDNLEITVSAPTAISITADTIIIGYDEDSDGAGNAFRESNGTFVPLSNFELTDNQPINGSWMIRLLLRQEIDTDDIASNFETAIRGDDWIEFDYSDGVVTIPYTIAQEGQVGLFLYDLLGRTVRYWNEGVKSPGKQHQVFWNGKSSSGHISSSGIYFIRLKAQNDSAVKKLKFIK